MTICPHCSIFYVLVALFLFLPCIHTTEIQLAHIPSDYISVTSRPWAYPHKLTFTSDKNLMSAGYLPVSRLFADGAKCIGTGGLALSNDHSILHTELPLPHLQIQPDSRFFSAVETSTRLCGESSFNTSSITWFVINLAKSRRHESTSGTQLFSRRLNALVTYFAHACVYKVTTALPEEVRLEDDVQDQDNVMHSHQNSKGAMSWDEQTGAAAVRSMPACFSGSGLVTLRNGSTKLMRELNIGDSVLVANSQYSDVFAFSHASELMYTFVRIWTHHNEIVLSNGHVLYVNGKPRLAYKVERGDFVTEADGRKAKVERVDYVRAMGLYNPHTLSGDIVVDGILATTWTETVPGVTANCLLAPLRWLYQVSPGMATVTNRKLTGFLTLAQGVLPQWMITTVISRGT